MSELNSKLLFESKFSAKNTDEFQPALFILWENCSLDRKLFFEILCEQFTCVKHFNGEWTANHFSGCLTRFYGENLPKNSGKEQHVGTGPFDIYTFIDTKPIFEMRQTSRGLESVNTNLFDLKAKARELDGGGHKIHGTVNHREGLRDIWLIFGVNYWNLFDDAFEALPLPDISNPQFKSINDVFQCLNHCQNYVALRNFEGLEDGLDLSVHGDIDLLVDNRDATAHILAAEKVFPEEHRTHYEVTIDGNSVPFDLRYVDDDYYDPIWSENILLNRQLSNGFFVPNAQDHCFSLLYHALFHKLQFSSEYKAKIKRLFSDINYQPIDEANFYKQDIYDYLSKNKYFITPPIDKSVLFNAPDVKTQNSIADRFKCIDSLIAEGRIDDFFVMKNKLAKHYSEHHSENLVSIYFEFFEYYVSSSDKKIAVVSPTEADLNYLAAMDLDIDIICGASEQHEFYQTLIRGQKSEKITILDFNKNSIGYEYRVILICGSMDYLQNVQNSEIFRFLESTLSEDGIIFSSFSNHFTFESIINNQTSRKIDFKKNDPQCALFDYFDFIRRLADWGFKTVFDGGMHPSISEARFLINRPNETIVEYLSAFRSSFHASSFEDDANLLQIQKLKDQLGLANLLGGKIFILSKSSKAVSRELANLIFAKITKNRLSKYNIITFGEHQAKRAVVKKRRISGDTADLTIEASFGEHSFSIIHSVEFRTEWFEGPTLAEALLKSIKTNDVREADRLLSLWASFVLQYMVDDQDSLNATNSSFPFLGGAIFDLGPQNLIIVEQAQIQPIDNEWRIEGVIPFPLYLMRSAMCGFDNSGLTYQESFQLVRMVAEKLDLVISNDDQELYSNLSHYLTRILCGEED